MRRRRIGVALDSVVRCPWTLAGSFAQGLALHRSDVDVHLFPDLPPIDWSLLRDQLRPENRSPYGVPGQTLFELPRVRVDHEGMERLLAPRCVLWPRQRLAHGLRVYLPSCGAERRLELLPAIRVRHYPDLHLVPAECGRRWRAVAPARVASQVRGICDRFPWLADTHCLLKELLCLADHPRTPASHPYVLFTASARHAPTIDGEDWARFAQMVNRLAAEPGIGTALAADLALLGQHITRTTRR